LPSNVSLSLQRLSIVFSAFGAVLTTNFDISISFARKGLHKHLKKEKKGYCLLHSQRPLSHIHTPHVWHAGEMGRTYGAAYLYLRPTLPGSVLTASGKSRQLQS